MYWAVCLGVGVGDGGGIHIAASIPMNTETKHYSPVTPKEMLQPQVLSTKTEPP